MEKQGRLEGKIALITGGCSGIGLATVELFIKEGALVIAADIQDEKGALLQERFGNSVRYVHCDVSSEKELAAAILVAEPLGGLDILFNNAGAGGAIAGVENMTSKTWDAMFALLVRAPALGMHYALPQMLKRGGGSIINTASVAGLQAGYGPLAYSTAKAAVIHLTRCAAAELSPKGIRVNAICPGLICTSIFGSALGMSHTEADELAKAIALNAASAQPVHKPGLPEDIASVALFLASSESAFITGTHLVVDGGITVGPTTSWDPTAPSPIQRILGLTPEQVAQLRSMR